MQKLISLLEKHNNWRKNCINLIASENVMSPLAEKAYFSDLMHRYAEGLPFKRYYQGLSYFDQIEELVTQAYKAHFKANFSDLRPISGTLSNMAVFAALTQKGDKIITLGIEGGSHVFLRRWNLVNGEVLVDLGMGKAFEHKSIAETGVLDNSGVGKVYDNNEAQILWRGH